MAIRGVLVKDDPVEVTSAHSSVLGPAALQMIQTSLSALLCLPDKLHSNERPPTVGGQVDSAALIPKMFCLFCI